MLFVQFKISVNIVLRFDVVITNINVSSYSLTPHHIVCVYNRYNTHRHMGNAARNFNISEGCSVEDN